MFVRAPSRVLPSAFCKADLRHNHNPGGAVSKADEHVLPLEFVDARTDDIRRWTAANLGPQEVFKLLHADGDNRLLCQAGKKKVSCGCNLCS